MGGRIIWGVRGEGVMRAQMQLAEGGFSSLGGVSFQLFACRLLARFDPRVSDETEERFPFHTSDNRAEGTDASG